MRQIAPQLLALVLVVSLSFPNPAYALRAPQRERRAQTTGLEESLQGSPQQLTGPAIGSPSGLKEAEQLVGEIEQRIAADGDVASYLAEDLVGLLNRVAPGLLPASNFQTLSRLGGATGQQVIPVDPAYLQSQGITALSLGDAFRWYRHQAAFDYMDNEQHVATVLRRLQAIVDLAHSERGPSIRQDLPSRGEERPREIRDSAGIWRPQGAREPLVPTGLLDAEPFLQKLGQLYWELPPQIKRDLWLSVLFHDIAKPINVGDHDRIGAGMVPGLLKGTDLPAGDIELISAVILPHTLFGISYLREANRWEVIRNLTGIAQVLPDPSQRNYFPTMLLLLTAADVDAIGAKGKLSVERLDYWLQLHDEVQAAIRQEKVSEPDAAALRAFGMERLAVFTDPLPGHPHSKQDFVAALGAVFGADSGSRDRFLERLGRVYRFSYAYEPLRAMADPVSVVQFFRVLLNLMSDQDLSYQINFFDDSLGFRRVDRDRIEQIRQLVTDPHLVVDLENHQTISGRAILRVEKNPTKPEILVKFESGLEEKGSLRFLVDTGAGEPGVLRLLEMAVQLRLKDGVPVQAAGVATAEELAEAEAAMPDDISRESLRSRVFTYTPGDEESHRIARALAEASVPELAGLHPELVITEMNRSTVTWFLQALQRLGVNRFTHEMFDRVESYLTAT